MKRLLAMVIVILLVSFSALLIYTTLLVTIWVTPDSSVNLTGFTVSGGEPVVITEYGKYHPMVTESDTAITYTLVLSK